MPMTENTIRFASWERVSTEDRQDPESSRAWQYARGKSLIEPHGGVIVAEFFDIDKSRSIPPQRRPEASKLLAALADPDRGFDAVVVGGAAAGLLRQPVRPDVPGVHSLRRRAVGPRGRRSDRSGLRGTRPGDDALWRHVEGRADPH